MDKSWVEAKAKESIGENFVKTILELSGYKVMKYGIENHNQNMIKEIKSNYKPSTNRRLLSMPDLVVVDEETKESWLVEIKYRTFQEFKMPECNISFRYGCMKDYLDFWKEATLIFVFNVSPFCLCVDLDSIENSIDTTNFENWKKSMDTEEVKITLPKFKFETKYFMAEDLKEMGMPTAFEYPKADFTGISPPTAESPNGELYIGEVIHQTFIEVAEYGTEAAAATAVIMKADSAGPTEEPKVFNADHPFIFIIQQKGTGNILFMGRVSNPSD